MADLVVKPSIVLGPTDILTVDKFNLAATPVVELSLTDPVNDQNFFRNGNFYSSFWTTPAGIKCPAGIWTTNASYWQCQPDVTAPFTSLTAAFTQPAVAGTSSTTLTAAFTQPAINATVSIAVVATAWMTATQAITIAGGGEYTVSSITDGTHAVVRNLGSLGNAAPAASVPTGGAVGPTSRVAIAIGSTSWMSPTQVIYIVGGGDYTVVSVTDGTHANVSNLGHSGNVAPGATVQSGGWVSPSSAAVTFSRATQVPDLYSLFSAQIQGASSVADVEFGQQISADLAATLRRNVTFSGHIYNATGLVLAPKLRFYTADAFNNFSALTLRSTINLQSGADSTWTYVTATIDLTAMVNVANGLLVAILIPSGALNDPLKNVFFSRLKIQIGEVATEFVDDPSLFVQTPSVDSTMLQDGCIARPSLFQPNVIPTGAYQAKSINNGGINDRAIDGRTMATGATAANLGYTPINKAGDTGVGTVWHTVDTVVGPNAFFNAGVEVQLSAAQVNNDGYFPAIGFHRNGGAGRAIGLAVDGRLKTVDGSGTVGYLLDSIHKVDNASIQGGAITYDKLAQALIDLICPVATVTMFAGTSIPAGWFICDGSAVSRTTYADLFAQIGTIWGTGDGVSTYNLPDLRGRAPIGYAPSGAPGITARAFGSRGGEENHGLSTAEMPSHTHANDPHTHSFTGVGAGAAFGGSGWAPVAATTGPTAVTIQATGGNGAHNNMQPFGVLYFIIKAIK